MLRRGARLSSDNQPTSAMPASTRFEDACLKMTKGRVADGAARRFGLQMLRNRPFSVIGMLKAAFRKQLFELRAHLNVK